MDATAYHRGRWMEAKYPGYCAACGASVWRGARIWYVPRLRRVECAPCGKRTAGDGAAGGATGGVAGAG